MLRHLFWCVQVPRVALLSPVLAFPEFLCLRRDILHPVGAKASNRLAKQLFASSGNEILNVQPAPALDLAHEQSVEIKRLSTLEDFRGALRTAFNAAQTKLLVVSPFLSEAVIVDDNIVALYNSTVKRGVEVRIVFDQLKVWRNEWFMAGRILLEENGVKPSCCPNIYNKTFWVDDHYMVEGSFNWLSTNRRSLTQKENAFV